MLAPIRQLHEKRGGSAATAVLSVRDIEQRVADMEKAIASGEWGKVITLHDEIKQLHKRFTAPESLRPAFAKAEEMFHLASAHRGFEALELARRLRHLSG